MTAACAVMNWPMAAVLIVCAICMLLLAAAIAGIKPKEPTK